MIEREVVPRNILRPENIDPTVFIDISSDRSPTENDRAPTGLRWYNRKIEKVFVAVNQKSFRWLEQKREEGG